MAVAAPEPETNFVPYVPDNSPMKEFTWSAVLTGAVLGIVFGASSLYLVLKIGMTVSASIPVAVLAITLFRWLAKAFNIRQPTILENNIIQTTGSAGESIAFGVGVTMPALMLIGFEMDIGRVMVVAILGGLLGILMMIPLRRAFIVNLHASKPGEEGKLLYPEGTACAQVLKSAEQGGSSGATIFAGFGLAFVHKFLTEGMNVLKETLVVPLGYANSGKFAPLVKNEFASELLGVGYIIGARLGAIMLAGAILGSLVIVPTIAHFGHNSPSAIAPATTTIGDMDADAVRKGYLVFIGAGCVAAAGLMSMAKTMPMIIRSLKQMGALGSGRRDMGEGGTGYKRTEDDMSPKVVLGGALGLLALLTIFLVQQVNVVGAVLGAVLVVVLGYLFVTVSSRLTGEVGSTNNPISGMTTASLLLTCLLFLAFSMTTPRDALLAISVAGVVCIAISNGGTTSQDLKTGYLIGSTPRWQQWAILIGALTSALVIGATLVLFNQAGTVYSTRDLPQIDARPFFTPDMPTAEYEGKTYKVWYPSPAEYKQLKDQGVTRGKYLVDDAGRIQFLVDPTITGTITERDHFEPLTSPMNLKAYVKDLKHTAMVDGKVFHIWTVPKPPETGAKEKEGEKKEETLEEKLRKMFPGMPAGEYLVDDEGNVRYVNQPQKVGMKFAAPKTQVMGIIINGLLNQELDWTLIILGALIAVALELCGVSALVFAVGFYVPMEYSVPIFLGGMVRLGVEWWTRPPSPTIANAESPADEVDLIAKQETSPAVLLASGFIAGGSLAGVLAAFLNMAEPLKNAVDMEKRLEGSFIQSDEMAIILFLGLMAMLALTGMGKLFGPGPPMTGGLKNGDDPNGGP